MGPRWRDGHTRIEQATFRVVKDSEPILFPAESLERDKAGIPEVFGMTQQRRGLHTDPVAYLCGAGDGPGVVRSSLEKDIGHQAHAAGVESAFD
jgi:hypothetical protein